MEVDNKQVILGVTVIVCTSLAYLAGYFAGKKQTLAKQRREVIQEIVSGSTETSESKSE